MTTRCSDSYRSVKDFHVNARRMLDEANVEIKKLFRSSRKLQVSNRSGFVLLVDDYPFQKTVLVDLFKMYNLDIDVYNVSTVSDAKSFINGCSDNIRLVIVDIMLLGSLGEETSDGLSLVDWLRANYSSMPFVITTGNVDKALEASDRFPDVDVFIKGETDIDDYADAIGITMLSEKKNDEKKQETRILPTDF